MIGSFELALCDTQGQIFALSGERGYGSETFIKAFMNSSVAKEMDKVFHHVQWAGKEYVFSAFEDECGETIEKSGETFDRETLYWIGYLYRYWNLCRGEDSRTIYKQAPAKTMQAVYLMYHTMSPEMAIDRLRETYREGKHGKR